MERPVGMPAEATHKMQDIYYEQKYSTQTQKETNGLLLSEPAKASFHPASVLEMEKRKYSYSELLTVLIRVNIQLLIEVAFLSFCYTFGA